MLDAIDLTISTGELLAIVGPSGSGKTTLLRLLSGLDRPSSGTIFIDGRDARDRPPRDRDVALVFQNQAPYPHRNGYDNLAFGAEARGFSASEIRSRVEEVADFLGVRDVLDRKPAMMSGGEKQRLAIGRALVRRPSLLLLDEPFSNLDAPLRVFLRSRLAEAHRRSSLTTVLVTHDQEDALALGDRVAVLQQGRLAQVGTEQELYERPANRFVARFLGNPPMGEMAVSVRNEDGSSLVEFPIAPGQAIAPAVVLPIVEGPYFLGLRLEHIHLMEGLDTADPAAIRLKVISIEDRCHERIARVGSEDEGFWVRLPPGRMVRPGDAVPLHLDLDHASWFDPRTGDRRI